MPPSVSPPRLRRPRKSRPLAADTAASVPRSALRVTTLTTPNIESPPYTDALGPRMTSMRSTRSRSSGKAESIGTLA